MPCQVVMKIALLVQAALAVMMAGAAVVGSTDLKFSLPGYTWVLVCAISTAVYLLLIKSLNRDTSRRL
jgi:drug/metabolite transporter (DMT)-like permease